MNRLISIAAGSALVAFSAVAQQDETKRKAELDASTAMVKMKMMGAVRGATVKGAPYSADEITETTQVLADGTRIHRENKVSVSRDGEGRMRHETPDSITITDPVANVTYLLNPKTMTGQKVQMAAGNFTFLRTPGPVGAAGSTPSTFTVTSDRVDGPVSIVVNGEKLDEKTMAEALAKAKESGRTVTYDRRTATTGEMRPATAIAGTAGAYVMAGAVTRKRAAGEPLGKQMIEGVNAEGTRSVTTLETGSIGNDRPIAITTESWYSDELQMEVMSKRSDPRSGDETFRVTNIRRGEPGAYLFLPPAGYQINDRK